MLSDQLSVDIRAQAEEHTATLPCDADTLAREREREREREEEELQMLQDSRQKHKMPLSVGFKIIHRKLRAMGNAQRAEKMPQKGAEQQKHRLHIICNITTNMLKTNPPSLKCNDVNQPVHHEESQSPILHINAYMLTHTFISAHRWGQRDRQAG